MTFTDCQVNAVTVDPVCIVSDQVQCIATTMCGAADMLHHVERRQHITETTTVQVSRQLKSDIKVPASHNWTCTDDQCL